jgi:hypothetical protein
MPHTGGYPGVKDKAAAVRRALKKHKAKKKEK